MKAKYPERPVVIGMGLLCIFSLIGLIALTLDSTLRWMLLGIEVCVIIALVWYARATR